MAWVRLKLHVLVGHEFVSNAQIAEALVPMMDLAILLVRKLGGFIIAFVHLLVRRGPIDGLRLRVDLKSGRQLVQR